MSSHISTHSPQGDSSLLAEIKKLQYDLRQETKRADRAQEDMAELRLYHEQRVTELESASLEKINKLERERNQAIADKEDALTSLTTLKQEYQALSTRHSEVVEGYTSLQAQVKDFRTSILATELGRTLREPETLDPIDDDQVHEPHENQKGGTIILPHGEITQSTAEPSRNEGQELEPRSLKSSSLFAPYTPAEEAEFARLRKVFQQASLKQQYLDPYGIPAYVFENDDSDEGSVSGKPEQVSKESLNPVEPSIVTKKQEGSSKDSDNKKRPRSPSSRSRSPRRHFRAN